MCIRDRQDLACIVIIRNIPGQGNAVAIGLIDRVPFLNRVHVHAIGVLVDQDRVTFAQMGF